MIVSFHPCLVTDNQVILGSRSFGDRDRELMARADAVLLPQTCPEVLYRAAAAACDLVFPSYGPRFDSPGKVGQARLFLQSQVPHPRTRVWPSVRALRQAVEGSGQGPHGLPFMVKTDLDHEGEGVRLVRDLGELQAVLDLFHLRVSPEGNGILTQECIPSGGNVLRAVILGSGLKTYWKRTHGRGGAISTISRGASIDHEWRPDLQEKGRVLAGDMRGRLGINLAAVDMVFPLDRENPEPLVLEINYSFGRRGLGGSEAYYRLLHEAVREWLREKGLDAGAVTLA